MTQEEFCTLIARDAKIAANATLSDIRLSLDGVQRDVLVSAFIKEAGKRVTFAVWRYVPPWPDYDRVLEPSERDASATVDCFVRWMNDWRQSGEQESRKMRWWLNVAALLFLASLTSGAAGVYYGNLSLILVYIGAAAAAGLCGERGLEWRDRRDQAIA